MNKYLSTILESSSIDEEEYELLNPEELYSGITESVSIPTTPEQARVVRISQNEYAISLNELSEVTKFLAESGSSCNEYDALEKVCEVNNLQLESMCVIIPNQEAYEAFVEACKKEYDGCKSQSGKNKAKSKIQAVKNKIKNLKDKGIKIKKQK